MRIQKLFAAIGLSLLALLPLQVQAAEIGQGLPEENMVIYQTLPEELWYASGVGGWGNELHIAADGSFTGQFHDSDMGDSGEGYPNGTLYLCNYEGQFSVPSKVSDTVYALDLMYLDYILDFEDGECIDGIRYCETEAWGIADGNTFYLYLPGTPRSDLPEAIDLTPHWSYHKELTEIPEGQCVLYNEKDDICFVGIAKESEDSKNTCQYILPNVSRTYYTKKQIRKLTLQEVNYAKNEIYAIHGRKFQSQELQDYFNSTEWYIGTIDGADFSDKVFNQYEQANLKLLVDRENELAGSDGYPLNKPGYDIHAVRQGYLDGYDQADDVADSDHAAA